MHADPDESDAEVALSGGLTKVSRIGRTVRRPAGPWTPAVHALLRHLEEVGFDGAPRALDVDGEGREVLTYVDGEQGHHARRPDLHSDEALAAVGKMIRRYHEAVAGFVPPDGTEWRTDVVPPGDAGSILCHNDLGPHNTIYVDGQPRAFIDWEYAAPAPPIWDLAYAAWCYVPLYDDEFCLRYSYPVVPRGPRIRLLCDAYGLDDRTGFLDVVRARQQAQYDMLRNRALAGDSQAAALLLDGPGPRWLGAMRYLDQHREEWARWL